MQDDLYHGLMQIDGLDVYSNCNFDYLFDDYEGDIRMLYGKGVSYAKNLPASKRKVVSSEAEIYNCCMTGYYDAIIYLSVRRQQKYLMDFIQNPRLTIACIDGEDDQLLTTYHNALNFKRELVDSDFERNVLPISFAIPEEKILQNMPRKTRLISTQVPGFDRRYHFDTEAEYYREYQESQFAITTKKAGWDCKRHYEILANRCIPIFPHIEDCPDSTMTTLPKKLLHEIDENYLHAPPELIQSWASDLFGLLPLWTTQWLANRVLTALL
jgi:hypothetical protein